MIKKIFIILMCVFILLGVTGCSFIDQTKSDLNNMIKKSDFLK